MSLEGFVRASGAVMGSAREAFGPGGAAVPARGGVGVLPGGPAASGAAADGFDDETRQVGAHVSALSEHDAASDADLAQAVAAAGVGRERMDSVIAAAVGDVERLGMSTNTYAGQRALVDAITRRLEESKSTLQQSHSDATTRAASADTTAAGYNGIGTQTTPASMLGAGGMPAGAPSMPMLPSMPMPSGMGMPMMGGGLPLAPLTNLASMLGGGTSSALAGAGSIPESAVKTAATAVPAGALGPGRGSEKGLQRYTVLMNRAVSAAFPEITDIGGVRADSLKWHPQGLALDFMIPNPTSPGGVALGNRVVDFILKHNDKFHVDHVIWRQMMYGTDGSVRKMEDRGGMTANHYDHVHAATQGGGYPTGGEVYSL
ncbi:DUF4226 domain-containing protein [Mycolicibacterium peregrinum]|nr:DUF4226 domain-containing protein [Mycolicibacterium peregrinum]